MYSLMEKSCSSIIDTLYHQSVFCITLFILILCLSRIFKGKPPHWQLGLWYLLLIRLISPIDLSLSFSARDLVDELLSSCNVNASLKTVSERLSVKKRMGNTSSPLPYSGGRTQPTISEIIANRGVF